MPIPDFFHLAGIEISADWDKRTVDIKLGPFKLTAVPWPVAKSLSDNPLLIEQLLSHCFIEKRVMWLDACADREPRPCLDSLRDLSETLQSELSKVQASKSRADQLFGKALLSWNSVVVAAIKSLEDTIAERDGSSAERHGRSASGTTAEMEAPRLVYGILSALRMNSYPCVQFLCELLDRDDAIRLRAEHLLSHGRKSLETGRSIQAHELSSPSWQFSPEGAVRLHAGGLPGEKAIESSRH